MDCIPYINDLQIEINILKDIQNNGNCDIEQIDKKIKEKELLIQKCKENLSKLSINSIEYRLYLKILNGLKPSRAIEEIANENYKNETKPTDITFIWKKYYKKIKFLIKASEKPVN